MSDAVNNQAVETQELSEILQVRRDKLAALQQDGRDPFQQTKFRRSAWSEEIKADYDAFDGKTVSVAGRIMSKRGMGKAIFCHIKDDRGQIQLYIRAVIGGAAFKVAASSAGEVPRHDQHRA